MSIHACILGATGYGGGELMRLLSQHPTVTGIDGTSRNRSGEPFHAAHPHLRGIVEGDFTEKPDWAALGKAEHPVLFAAMPHGEFAAQWPALNEDIVASGLEGRLVVIDLSGDFRLADADAFQRYYGHAHPCPEWLGRFHYGLPEARGSGPRGSGPRGSGATRRDTTLIANPGCFATAVQLALAPLRDLQNPGAISVFAVTGSSGSGASPSATTHHPSRAHDFRAYKLDGHQHLGEVEQLFSTVGGRDIHLVTHSAPMVRGIFVTAQFSMPAGMNGKSLMDAYSAFYREAPFVRLVDGSPRVAAVVGSNFCDIGVQVNGDAVIVMSAIDNLVKGMSGQAIQNMNIALGLPQTTGLLQAPLYP